MGCRGSRHQGYRIICYRSIQNDVYMLHGIIETVESFAIATVYLLESRSYQQLPSHYSLPVVEQRHVRTFGSIALNGDAGLVHGVENSAQNAPESRGSHANNELWEKAMDLITSGLLRKIDFRGSVRLLDECIITPWPQWWKNNRVKKGTKVILLMEIAESGTVHDKSLFDLPANVVSSSSTKPAY